jgi:hypothetical protein
VPDAPPPATGPVITPLQSLLTTIGWSPARLAHALRGVAAERGITVAYDRTTVRRWLQGARPRPPAPALLLECLSRAAGRPVTAQEAGLTNGPAPFVDPSWQAEPIHKIIQLTRLELTQAASSRDSHPSLAALALPDWFTSASPRRSTSTLKNAAAEAEEAVLSGMAAVFQNTAELYGGEHVRIPLAAYISHHVTPLLILRTPGGPGEALMSATAQLTLLLAGMCADSGRHRTAQHYHQVAAQLASEAADDAMLSVALRSMVAHAYELGYHGPIVLDLARRAAMFAAGAPPAVQTYAKAQLAVLLAHHDKSAALAMLASATRSYQQVSPAPDSFSTYPPGALHFQRAEAFVAMGDVAAGIRAYTASLRMRQPFERRATVLTHAHLAEAHLRLGRLGPAVTHCRNFLDGYLTLHSARATDRLRVLHEQLLAYRNTSEVAEFLTASERFL